MNLNSREIRWLNIKSFFQSMLPLALLPLLLKLLLLLGQQASICTFDRLFVRLPSLCLGVYLLCTRLSSHFSTIHSVVILCAGDIRLLLKLRNVLKHTERRSSFAWNWNIKEDIPIALEVFLCFETERNETKRKTNRSSTKTSTQHASNIRERTGYNV